MRRSLVWFVLGAVMASASVAMAASTGVITIVSGQNIKYGTTQCQSGPNDIFLCVSRNGHGYSVGISPLQVLVTDKSGKAVYRHAND